MKTQRLILTFLLFTLGGFPPAVSSAETPAEKLLRARQTEFKPGLVKVADGVYTAVGFGVSPNSMLVGKDGVVIVDTQIDEAAAGKALTAFREITNLPVKAIILTHGHGDHTGGVGVFSAEGEDVQVWARESYGQEGASLSRAGLTIQRKRGARQGGFLLKPEQRINNGIAQAYWPKRKGAVFGAAAKPTHRFSAPRKRLNIAGLTLDLVAADGETGDQLYVWLPKKRVLFSGDNFYKSWPNLYAIRGTPYRDVQAWTQSLSAMLDEKPAFLVGGHTRPIRGARRVREVLTNYRDAIASVFEQTIAGMNRGLTPDELVEVVKLPARFSKLDYLREYYGNIEWAVRAIFEGHLGWFDGNPSNLFPLAPRAEAERVAKLAGGADGLLLAARAALAEDPQWTAQLCDHLLALNPQAVEPKRLKADALEALSRDLLTATGRNYYRTTAQELRRAADEGEKP